MPKILINEIDRTSAGTPGEYSNNSVLICGFSTRTNEEIIATMEKNPNAGFTLPDENGVFEFYSKDDFKDTIGKVAPVFSDGEHVPAHYGNQMAYVNVLNHRLCKLYDSCSELVKVDDILILLCIPFTVCSISCHNDIFDICMNFATVNRNEESDCSEACIGIRVKSRKLFALNLIPVKVILEVKLVAVSIEADSVLQVCTPCRSGESALERILINGNIRIVLCQL